MTWFIPSTISAAKSDTPQPDHPHKFNNRRLHGQITPGPGYTTPAAFEAAYYRQTTPAPVAGTQ